MEFLLIDENDLIINRYSPLNVVFTLIYGSDGYMLVQNKESNFWELPAGDFKQGETLRECAIRRCKETSNQNAMNLNLFGICKMVFENKEKYEYFAIYSAELGEELPYVQNDETTGMRWYKPGQDIDKLCNTCRNVINYYELIKTI